mgnify:CR=1 FL=1
MVGTKQIRNSNWIEKYTATDSGQDNGQVSNGRTSNIKRKNRKEEKSGQFWRRTEQSRAAAGKFVGSWLPKKEKEDQEDQN